MKRVFWLLALMGAVLLSAAPVPADDGFYVIAGRYTPGTKITKLPYPITAPGYYYLTGNLSYTGNAITVNANDVTIDLMGFSLTGPGTGGPIGITINGSNVEVRNGTVSGWYIGIWGEGPSNARVINARANGNIYGIWLNGNNHLIKGCMASQGTFGAGVGLTVGSGTISDSTVRDFTGTTYAAAIYSMAGPSTITGNAVLNCTGAGVRGIYAAGPATISHNSVINCSIGISGAGGGSVIGNAVRANSGQSGTIYQINPNNFDQNANSGDGNHYVSGGSSPYAWGVNAY